MKNLEKAGMIVKAKKKTRAISLPHSEDGPPQDTVPILGNVAAGAPILAEECIEDYLTFDTGGLSGEHFALRVRGESMRDAGILPGDLVVVHQQQRASAGDIVVAMINGEATVKTLRRRDGHVWLMPENPEYEPIPGDHAEILGRVTAVVRRY
jgi:repressor LexA